MWFSIPRSRNILGISSAVECDAGGGGRGGAFRYEMARAAPCPQDLSLTTGQDVTLDESPSKRCTARQN